jgi:hypothetical protein
VTRISKGVLIAASLAAAWPAVDGVLGQQVEWLKAAVETGRP